MTIRDDLEQLCRIEAQIATLDAERDRLRCRLRDVAIAQLDEQGAAPTWRVAGMGTVSLSVPQPKPHVVDDQAFTAFVEARYGAEALEIRVRKEATEALFAESSVVPATAALVTADGEKIPGVTVSARPPFLTVRLARR